MNRVLAGGAALVLLAAAVAGAYALWGREELKADGPLVVTDASWFFGGASSMDANGGGVLSIEEECVQLGGYPVVCLDGTSWDEDERAVRLPGDPWLAPAIGSRAAVATSPSMALRSHGPPSCSATACRPATRSSSSTPPSTSISNGSARRLDPRGAD